MNRAYGCGVKTKDDGGICRCMGRGLHLSFSASVLGAASARLLPSRIRARWHISRCASGRRDRSGQIQAAVRRALAAGQTARRHRLVNHRCRRGRTIEVDNAAGAAGAALVGCCTTRGLEVQPTGSRWTVTSPPEISTRYSGSASSAGPVTTSPVEVSNSELWHGQWMFSSFMRTRQP